MNINQKRISSSEENTRTPSFRELTLLNTLLNLSFSGLRPFDFAFHIYIHRRPGRLGPHFCTYVSRRFFTRPSRARRRARRAKRAMMRLLRLVHDEGGHLHLLLGVEADHPDVVVRILLLAVGHLLRTWSPSVQPNIGSFHIIQ